jgi:tRNA threonylcarbamoyladenosine biosynthesis protein TsaB
MEEAVKAGPYTIMEFMEAVKDFDNVLFMGDGIDTCGAKILEARETGVEFCEEDIRYQDAVTVAKLGEKLLAAGQGRAYNDVQPEYMRIAEAERKLKEQQAQEK